MAIRARIAFGPLLDEAFSTMSRQDGKNAVSSVEELKGKLRI
jgi:hypothetical protein